MKNTSKVSPILTNNVYFEIYFNELKDLAKASFNKLKTFKYKISS
jgi:hypothetical protein